MQVTKLMTLVLGAGLGTGLIAGCGDNSGDDDPMTGDPDFPVASCSKVTGTCVEVKSSDAAGLLTTANTISDNTTIVLGKGKFAMTNQVTIRNNGVHLIGQGIDMTTLDFAATTGQSEGVDVISNGFLIQDVTVLDAKKDGIRVESSNGVTFRRIRATWTAQDNPSNGAYGIYPVKSQNVLVENSRAENAADAGLYVGQCQHVIVRNNVVTGNVAGLEIENTQYADVYGNTAENNTGGIVVFDLPGNPIIGRDVRLRDNIIRNNNHHNFAAGGTVAVIPVGTGTFAMASRRVEITGNTYENNNTIDISVISGKVVEPDKTKWAHVPSELVGKYDDLALLAGDGGTLTNYRSENIVISGNHHKGSGTKPDQDDLKHLGQLLMAMYGGDPISNVTYDAFDETGFNSTTAASNTNENHICIGGNTEGTFGSLGLEHQAPPLTILPPFAPASPFVPFDCKTLNGGAVADVVLTGAP